MSILKPIPQCERGAGGQPFRNPVFCLAGLWRVVSLAAVSARIAGMLKAKPTPFDHEIRQNRRHCRRRRGIFRRSFLLPELRPRLCAGSLRRAEQVILFSAYLPAGRPKPTFSSAPSAFPSGSPIGCRTKPIAFHSSMTRILLAFAAFTGALVSASCCCTGEARAPRLNPLPKFQEIQTPPAPVEVQYSGK